MQLIQEHWPSPCILLQGDRLIRHVPLSAEAGVVWGTEGFAVSQGNEITLYTPPGEAGARLVFSRPVSLVLWRKETLLVETGNNRFVFRALPR